MPRLLTKPLRILYAVGYFLVELVLANLRLATDIAVPGRLPATKGIIRVTTAARTPAEVWVVANAISMTPGTLTLETDAEHHHLYVHTLYAQDRAAFTKQIHALESALLGAMR
ncbi:MAG: Na+/H+ antiporter subunit E [Nitriliruptor sp.]|uniref:Na+/H+ antiporter subunit E n=1 Tax=Nitriliruptor sp. TaxID=2448056 RepID=UPI0034A099AB